MKRVLFLLAWTCVFFLSACILIGVIASLQAGGDEGKASERAREISQRWGTIAGSASLALAVALTLLKALPGTRGQQDAGPDISVLEYQVPAAGPAPGADDPASSAAWLPARSWTALPADSTVQFGPVGLSQFEINHQGKTLAWKDVECLTVILNRGSSRQLKIWRNGSPFTWTSIDLAEIPNEPVFLEVLRQQFARHQQMLVHEPASIN